jgi:hypothetical protein
MMTDDTTALPAPIEPGDSRAVSTLARLALIPEEDIWLAGAVVEFGRARALVRGHAKTRLAFTS